MSTGEVREGDSGPRVPVVHVAAVCAICGRVGQLSRRSAQCTTDPPSWRTTRPRVYVDTVEIHVESRFL